MKILKKQLEVLFLSLKGTENVLTLAESRIRDSFIKQVASELDTFYADRKKIFEKFCIKDEDGKPLVKNDQYNFENEVLEELNAEITTLLNEEVSIPTEHEVALKVFITKTEYKPKLGEAEIIDQIIGKDPVPEV